MKINNLLLALVLLFWSLTSTAQKSVTSFIFGHSLINHEAQVNPTPSQETSVPHWLHFLSESAGNEYAVSGQYGFLSGHAANLPPFSQWGFDYAQSAWDSDFEPFASAGFNNILITPSNFEQWQSPHENYYNDPVYSPISATQEIFEWCLGNDEDLKFYVYENWPDMAGYLSNDFPPSQSEWNEYNAYTVGAFHDWFIEYHDGLIDLFSDACIKMIPVGPLISGLLMQSPFDEIPIDQLYEDDAPHGRPNIYFLASIITYMAFYEEKPPSDYMPDPIIHPLIADNYDFVLTYFWNSLSQFNFDDDTGSRVFCSPPVSTNTTFVQTDNIQLGPNPADSYFTIKSGGELQSIEMKDLFGNRILSPTTIRTNEQRIDILQLPKGIHLIVGRDRNGNVIYTEKVIKM